MRDGRCRWVVQRCDTLWLKHKGMEGEMQCPQCAGEQFTRAGRDCQQRQQYWCKACRRLRRTAWSCSTRVGAGVIPPEMRPA